MKTTFFVLKAVETRLGYVGIGYCPIRWIWVAKEEDAYRFATRYDAELVNEWSTATGWPTTIEEIDVYEPEPVA